MRQKTLYEAVCHETGERISAYSLYNMKDCLDLIKHKTAEDGLNWYMVSERVWA